MSMEKVAKNAVAEGLLSAETAAELVHTAYGMSKDFGMNGFRVGCLHTKNKDLLEVRRFSWSLLYGMPNFLQEIQTMGRTES